MFDERVMEVVRATPLEASVVSIQLRFPPFDATRSLTLCFLLSTPIHQDERFHAIFKVKLLRRRPTYKAGLDRVE